MVHLITGYKGSEHIQSADARSFNSAMFGNGEFVMEIGEQLDASILNNNTVRVLDGDVLMQGGHIRIETDTYEDLTIETGTAGKSRNDLIVMTYEKNSMDGTEKAYLEVIKGTETEGSASDPEYVTGTLAEGDLKNQMPLYRLKIEGVVLSTIETLFKTIPTYKTLAEQYAAQFQKACDTYLGALNILDSKEEIEANTLANQIAGALGVKQIMTSLNSNIVVVNLPQSGFTWQQSYIWRKQYTVPDGYTLEGIEVYSTNGDATLSGIYRSIDNAMYICVTGTYLDSTVWVVKPITNSYNFACNVRLRKVNN